MEGLEFEGWRVEEYEKSNTMEGIKTNIEEGYVLMGFESGEDWGHVLYLKIVN